MAPPTMAVDSIPEALVVYLPNPLTDSEKIMANITELKNPTPIIDQTARLPPELTETTTSRIAAAAHKVSTKDGFTVFSNQDPIKRPISIAPQ